ncbi:sulfite exporter TauE/SafE family protein [Methanosphaera cuniculi]|uniref:sulfite exporter TauE/SafE family protein n=1 Tax=Methanosphaera cuniculi TaxID=1077256 RepID=UPI0026F2426F|nr:sulfite exporter TauE/SafE family protein [Methanosphaera cuniculi]
MDIITYIILLLAGGCIGGFLAGLLGVGGGVILSPIQFELLKLNGVDPQLALPMAFATSLAVIFITMISGTYEHYKNGNVEKTGLKYLMIFGVIGSIIGAFLSTHLNVGILEILFGIMCMGSVVSMIVIKNPENDTNMNKSSSAHSILGFIAGILSGLLGVGGGIIMIPALTILLKYSTRKAIGTSSATIIATSIGGILSYIALGQGVTNLPPYSIGYVNILQFVIIAFASVIVAKYAANLSKHVNPKILKAFQIILVAYIGLRMFGIV